MSMSQRALVYVGCACLLGTGLGVWAGGGVPSKHASAMPADGSKAAVFDVLDVAEKLFQSSKYAPLREQNLKEKESQRDALQSGLNDLQQRIMAAGQGTAEAQAMLPTWQQKSKELQEFIQRADFELNQMSTKQFNECYRLAVESAQAVAKKQGYTQLLASKLGPLDFRSQDLEHALQEVLARPVLMVEPSDDITAQVKKELKVEDTPADAKKDGATPAPTPAPTTPPPAPAGKK